MSAVSLLERVGQSGVESFAALLTVWGAVWYGMVWGGVWYGVVWSAKCGKLKRGVVLCGVVF